MRKQEKVYNPGKDSFDLREAGVISRITHESRHLVNRDGCDLPVFTWKFTDVTRKDHHWFKHCNYPYLALEMTLSGTLEYYCDGRCILAPRRTLFLIAPGSNVRFANAGNVPRRKITLLIRGSLLPGLLSSLHFDQDQLLQLRDPELIEGKMREIGSLMDKAEQQERNSILTYGLLLHLASENPQPAYPELLQKALGFIQKKYKEHISVLLLAEELHISPATLNRLFRSHLDCSPHNYLMRYRLTQAAGMLANQTLAVKAVAENCGFNTPVRFSELFRKRYGVSPGSYRKKNAR